MARPSKEERVIAILERNAQLTRQFMGDWLHFNKILCAYPNPGVNKGQLEHEFLRIKSSLARQHRVLKETLGEDFTLDSNVMNIVSGATNLDAIYSTSDVAVKKLQNEWHRAFIAINEMLGAIDDKKARAMAGEKIYLPQVYGTKRAESGGAKTAVVIVAIIVLLGVLTFFGLEMFGVTDLVLPDSWKF